LGSCNGLGNQVEELCEGPEQALSSS